MLQFAEGISPKFDGKIGGTLFSIIVLHVYYFNNPEIATIYYRLIKHSAATRK